MKKTQTQVQAPEPVPFTHDQRKLMAKIVTDAKLRVADGFESDYLFNSQIEDEVAPKLAKEHGVLPLVEKTRKLQKDLADAEKELRNHGFSCGSDSVSIDGNDAPKELLKALDDAIDQAKQERETKLTKYDLAVLDVSAAQTAAEAKKIVEGVLNL